MQSPSKQTKVKRPASKQRRKSKIVSGAKVKTRKDALQMDIWDPALLWYAKAVGEMKKRRAKDPTSWKYQAAIHGFTLDRQFSASKYWRKWIRNDTLPGSHEQQTFWAQCQHGSWYFLPWHRIYLGYFEMIVASIVGKLGGPPDWALPYWNYDHSKRGILPAAFRQRTLPDGSTNPLYESVRDAGNDGKPFLEGVDVTHAFSESSFEGVAHGGPPGFGGAATRFHHSGGSHGALEHQPHDMVHDYVGGLMGDPDTAGYDPIFWLHHANIDRLWEAWLHTNDAHRNPIKSSWLTFSFKFNDGSGNTPTLTAQDILDTKAAPFYYQYEDIFQPASIVAPRVPAGISRVEPVHPMTEEPILEMVGASSKPTPLTGEAKTLGVRLFPVSRPMRALGADDADFQRAYLHIENIRGKGRPSSYAVYLNVPEGTKEPEQFYVGTIPMFGLEQASVASERHPGNGLRFTFNVTETINRLKAEGHWNPKLLRITFVPKRKPQEGSRLEVGRVSLYYA
jgi:tyrosinase